MKEITADELIQIAQNLQFMLYGFGIGGAGLLIVLGFIFKYLAGKLRKLEDLEAIKFRMDGIESFAATVTELNAEVKFIKLLLDRRIKDIPVEVDRRKV